MRRACAVVQCPAPLDRWTAGRAPQPRFPPAFAGPRRARRLLQSVSNMKASALVCLVVAGLGASGCAGGDASAKGKGAGNPADPLSITADETWSGTKELAGKITIEPGVTVTIAPGAQVSFGKETFVTVRGTLKASAASRHAKLSGEKWGGLIVVAGGSAALAGVDIDGATAALDVQGGAATYEDGTISWPSTPFRVLEGAALTLTRAVISNANGLARVKGTLTASRLEMDTLADTGIQADAQNAKVDIRDSKLRGHGAPTDVIVATAGAVHVSFTDISEAHCGLHFWNLNDLDVSNVTIHDVSYGAMLYGSSAGQRLSIADSNIVGTEDFGVHEADGSQNGPLQLKNVYFADNATDSQLQANSRISIQPALAAIASAKPR